MNSGVPLEGFCAKVTMMEVERSREEIQMGEEESQQRKILHGEPVEELTDI